MSAHPDVILKMGVKEVLHRTRHLGWGTDTHLYRTPVESVPGELSGAACVRQARECSSKIAAMAGQGVWKVEQVEPVPGGPSVVAGAGSAAGQRARRTRRSTDFMAAL